jgi:hypothetical protein
MGLELISIPGGVKRTVFEYSPYVVLAAGVAGGVWAIHKAGNYYSNYVTNKRVLQRWKQTPKDVVILHTLGRGKTVPNNSAFALKLETFLRMANIPYQLDHSTPFAPTTGKTPWITLNGENYVDSQLIIEFLSTKFTKYYHPPNYTAEQKANGHVLRILMDEHFAWGMSTWRWFYDENMLNNIRKLFDVPSERALRTFTRNANKRVTTNGWAQGILRLGKENVFRVMSDDLRALSTILGKRKFLLGDEPCSDDCAVFGMLAQVLWCMPDSPYEKLVTEELLNLTEYCVRMKETFWPDWEKCLAGAVVRC